jgi:hypothetical protein
MKKNGKREPRAMIAFVRSLRFMIFAVIFNFPTDECRINERVGIEEFIS